MTHFPSICLAAGLLLASATARTSAAADANTDASQKVGLNKNNDASAIRAQQQQIRAEVSHPKGRYKDLDTSRRDELMRHQTLVLDRLGTVERTTDLSEDDQLAVFNSLEAIEAIVNAAEDQRMICQRSKPVGSNRPKTVCRTVAELRAEKENADKSMARDQQCVDGWGSGACAND